MSDTLRCGRINGVDPLGKRELLTFYDRHLRDFGDAPGALRWTPEGQLRRYTTLLSAMGDITGKSVLDFGCGKGDLYGFFRERGISISYCGIDVNANLVALARRKYPDVTFLVLDLEEEAFDRRFDIVIAIGVFNLRIAGIEESMKNLLRKLFQLSAEALHVNFLTSHQARKDVELFYVDPEEILRLALKEFSPRVTLRHFHDDVFLSVYKT